MPNTNDSDTSDAQPHVLRRLTAWLTGLTAVVLALVGLQEAWKKLTVPAAVTASSTPNGKAEASSLPTRYKKPNGFLEKQGAGWLETDQNTGVQIAFEEISRSDGVTLLYDASRDLYLRWPNAGGQVRWAHSNPMVWTDLYFAVPAEAP